MYSMWVRDFRVLIAHKSFSWHSQKIKRPVRGEAVCNRDISHLHSHVPRDPKVPQSSIFCLHDPLLFTAGASVLSGDRMPQSIVPNTQFGLKLPWSCFEIDHGEASPLTFSPWGCSLNTQQYGQREDYQLSILSEGDVFICKDKNVYPVQHFFCCCCFFFFEKSERLQCTNRCWPIDVMWKHVLLVCFQKFCLIGPTTLNLTVGGIFRNSVFFLFLGLFEKNWHLFPVCF